MRSSPAARTAFWTDMQRRFDGRYPGVRTRAWPSGPNYAVIAPGPFPRMKRQFDLSKQGPRHQLLFTPHPQSKANIVGGLLKLEPTLRDLFAPRGSELLQVEALDGRKECRLAVYSGQPQGSEETQPDNVAAWFVEVWSRLDPCVHRLLDDLETHPN